MLFLIAKLEDQNFKPPLVRLISSSVSGRLLLYIDIKILILKDTILGSKT